MKCQIHTFESKSCIDGKVVMDLSPVEIFRPILKKFGLTCEELEDIILKLNLHKEEWDFPHKVILYVGIGNKLTLCHYTKVLKEVTQ